MSVRSRRQAMEELHAKAPLLQMAANARVRLIGQKPPTEQQALPEGWFYYYISADILRGRGWEPYSFEGRFPQQVRFVDQIDNMASIVANGVRQEALAMAAAARAAGTEGVPTDEQIGFPRIVVRSPLQFLRFEPCTEEELTERAAERERVRQEQEAAPSAGDVESKYALAGGVVTKEDVLESVAAARARADASEGGIVLTDADHEHHDEPKGGEA